MPDKVLHTVCKTCANDGDVTVPFERVDESRGNIQLVLGKARHREQTGHRPITRRIA